MDAIRYLDHNSVVWRALPVDFPPWRTVYHYFRKWDRDGTLNRLHNGLREQVRLAEGREADPSAAILWVIATCFRRVRMVRVRMVWVDGGYRGGPVTYGATLGLVVSVVAKLARQVGFKILHRRWVVERTFSWISRCRRTVRDYERLPEHHAAMVEWAMAMAMAIVTTRRLAGQRSSTDTYSVAASGPSVTEKVA